MKKGTRNKVVIRNLGVTFIVTISERVVVAEIDRVRSKIFRKYFFYRKDSTKKILGRAFCHPTDAQIYDEATGILLAISRCYFKFLRKVKQNIQKERKKLSKNQSFEDSFYSGKLLKVNSFLTERGVFSSPLASIFVELCKKGS